MCWIKVTTLTILTLVTVSANADTLEQETTHTANRFATAEAAIARALAYTGFDELESYSRSVQVAAEQMTVGERDPEVLRAEFDDKQLWKVLFHNVSLDFVGGCVRDVEAYLDAEQGRLIYIKSCCQSASCDTVFNASPASENPEHQLKLWNPFLRYFGLPHNPPSVRFVNVLKDWLIESNFSEANLVAATLVLRSGRGINEQPAWLLTLSGMPVEYQSPRTRTSHVGKPDFARLLVDATIGPFMGLEGTGSGEDDNPVYGPGDQPLDEKPDSDILSVAKGSTSPDDNIQSTDQAMAIALKYTGFDQLDCYTDSVHAATKSAVRFFTTEDSTTPFLADSIDGKKAWVITFKDLAVTNGKFLATFTVVLDAQTGRLFKIVHQKPGFDEGYWHIPTAADLSRQTINSGGAYIGFPEKKPNISFLQALRTKVPCQVLNAEQFTALYVIHSQTTPRRVWVISGLGVSTPLHSDNPAAPWYLRSTCRVLVDADNGEFIEGDNWPAPEPSDEEIEKNRYAPRR